MSFKKSITVLCCLASCINLFAQKTPTPEATPTLKSCILHNHEVYSETLRLAPDTTEHDLTLTFSLDSSCSTLTVSISSKKNELFVFYRDVTYGDVFSCCRKLKTEKLPYKVSADPSVKFRMAKKLYKTLPGKRRKYQFHQWIQYENMELIPTAFLMMSDTITQKFKLDANTTKASITLRDIFVLEHNGATPSQWNKMQIVTRKDFNTQYTIEIKNDPCYGEDSLIQSITSAHSQLSTLLTQLIVSFPDGKTTSTDLLEYFHNQRSTILRQYPKRAINTSCPELQNRLDQYNRCVDSILGLQCHLSVEAKESIVAIQTAASKRIDPNDILFKARKIDELVALMQLAKTSSERINYKQQCEKIIKETNNQIVGKAISNDEERRALEVFQQASNYFRKNCK